MKSFKPISAKALLAVASLACTSPAWALGLGDVAVDSYLNQPLQARIDLISRESDELESVTARLASAADYELIGASRESVSVPIRFSVENIDGDAYILATSNLPVGDPVLRLIVEVNWSNGRLLREYTLFLDPPAVPSAAPLPRKTEAAPEPAVSPVQPSRPEPEAAAASTEPARQAPAQAPTQAPTGDEYGPVASGETLWAIARDWSRGTGLGINQVMIAIQRENPNAFLKNNINLLKRGAILRMPDVASVERISASSANNEVVTQVEEFTNARSRESAASPATPLLADESAAPVSSFDQEQPETVPEPEPAPAEEMEPAAEEFSEPMAEAEEPVAVQETPAEAEPIAELQDQLELVPPSETSELDSTYGFEETEEDSTAVAATQSLRESLARTEEELINQRAQNEYLNERIRELEAQVAANQQGTVEDKDMAAMEQRLREERQAGASNQVWYGRFSYWLIGLLVLAAAFVGWLVSRRGGSAGDVLVEEEAFTEIKDEAEEVLRVLEDSEPAEAEAEPPVPAAESETAADEEPESTAKSFGEPENDAEVLDEESSDPEIQLDLARAYISMGDKEAARVILEEVVTNGSEEQQAEAKSMMDEL
jgi:pilus assembly protein FimV